jgi:HD-GYP domain-containing protein (c-di-GMP phosphodiesterase class II)
LSGAVNVFAKETDATTDESKDEADSADFNAEREEDQGVRIRERAYEIWEQRGRPEGRALDNWLRAKRELARAAEPEIDLRRAEGEIASLSRTERLALGPI